MPAIEQQKPNPKKPPGIDFDRLFKCIFSTLQYAKELLPLLLSKSELSVLLINSTSLEKDAFESRRAADLVLSIALKNSLEDVRLLILIEHKSKYESGVHDQLMNYQNDLRQIAVRNNRIRLVLPAVVYNGSKPWTWPLTYIDSFGDLFRQLPKTLRESVSDMKIRMLDLHSEELTKAIDSGELKCRAGLFLLKNIRRLTADTDSLAEVIERIGYLEKTDENLFLFLLDFVEKSIPGLTRELLTEALNRANRIGTIKGGGDYMNPLDFIREDAERIGLNKGRQEIVMKMLKRELDTSLIAELTGYSEEEINDLANGSAAEN